MPYTTDFTVLASESACPLKLVLEIVVHSSAKRYILRVLSTTRLRVTMPRYGTLHTAVQFARSRSTWIEKQVAIHAQSAAQGQIHGDIQVLFRGQHWPLKVDHQNADPILCFAGHSIRWHSFPIDALKCVEDYLRYLAQDELPQRTQELADLHGIKPSRISIRNQRTRWGSCSGKHHISLNWRLIQLPLYVCDYVILHELMHCRELNHSVRFWNLLAQVCPDYLRARQWLHRYRLTANTN